MYFQIDYINTCIWTIKISRSITVAGQFSAIAKEVVNKDRRSTTLWGGGQAQVELNPGQMAVIQLVIGKKFQLIQGPPGVW